MTPSVARWFYAARTFVRKVPTSDDSVAAWRDSPLAASVTSAAAPLVSAAIRDASAR